MTKMTNDIDRLREIEGKTAHDPYNNPLNFITTSPSLSRRCVWVPGPIIIGGGPSGLAVSACLKCKGIPSLIIERSSCIASLWQLKTYDRLKLHLPKQFCELPFMPFPRDFPRYPTKQQFVKYLIDYAERFDINPVFNQRVACTEFEQSVGLWRVSVEVSGRPVEYLSRWVVAATGENAEAVMPEIEGLGEFEGEVVHTCRYKSGSMYKGKRVLVVGSGNSGMEVCLDLCNHEAKPSLVVKDTVHLLPRDMFGASTFGLSMWLLKWFPIRTVDWFLLAVARVMLGDTSRFGLDRPKLGPLELKNLSGKTPVLDIGTLDKIKSGDIKVLPGIRRVKHRSVEFVDARTESFDAIILATGYKSNVPCWLKENEMFSKKNGLPKQPFPNGWKGQNGLYAVGFTKRGLLGSSMDARNISEDIERSWKTQARSHMIQCKALYNL